MGKTHPTYPTIILLENQLKHIRDKKKQIVDASNKEMELFKKFQIAVQVNPNLTYAEFIKNTYKKDNNK